MTDIEVREVEFSYGGGEPVLKGVNFSVQSGQIAAIHGENGSGKSTLLKLLLGELSPNRGEVRLIGKPVREMTDFRAVGYVPQVQNFDGISFPVTTAEIVVLNLYRTFGFFKIPSAAHKKRAEKILCEMGMEKYLDTPYNQLSGGFKQRTMIARAMLNRPEILILDEPTAGVDQKSKENFLKLIAETNREYDTTILIVTHEMDLIQRHLKPGASYRMSEGVLLNA